MKEGIMAMAIIALLVTVLSFYGMASETLKVGNFSLTFNMSDPHQIAQYTPSAALIKTFDGTIRIEDGTGYRDPDPYIAWFPEGSDYIGTIGKNFKGDNWAALVYAKPYGDNELEYIFSLGFGDLVVYSKRNLTQSIDFFRDIGITYVGKEA
jgi:hypothetical protein